MGARAWLGDLWSAVRWYARHQVWSVPTRRWESPGSSRWPLPARHTPKGS